MEFNSFIKSFNYFIKKSKKILLQIHRNPDSDSVASAFILYEYLSKINKEVNIISPSEIGSDLKLLFPDRWNMIKVVDYSTFDFSKYDLLIINDTASLSQLAGKEDYVLPELNKIVIDHHSPNTIEVETKYVGDEFSNTELLYKILKKIGIKITAAIATYILIGMTTDTAFLKEIDLTSNFFRKVSDLIELGAEYSFILKRSIYSNSLEKLKLVGLALENIKVIKGDSYFFSYTYIDNETYLKYGTPDGIKELLTESLVQSVTGVDFGIVLIEKEKNEISYSIRSVTDFDCGALSVKLGGGGHKHAAGGTSKLSIDYLISSIREYK